MAHSSKTILALTVTAMTVAAMAASPAAAHTGGTVGSWTSGFLHPISGIDHVVAMVAVGLWGGILRAPAIWVLPVVFPMVMAFGGALGIAGVPLPDVETGIAVSGIVLGLMVLFAVRTQLWVAGVLVAVFAIFHCHAHGAELPGSANPLAYAAGFVIATGLLHLIGIAVGQLYAMPRGQYVVRGAGAAIALVGAAFLTGIA